MADDATAAFANPSGLVQLARPEISMELRVHGEFDETGFEGEATTLSGVGFLSFVYPRGDWSVALYRHQFGAAESPSGLVSFDELIGPSEPGVDLDATAELEIVTTAVAVAYRPRDSFSLGLGFSRFRGSLDSEIVEEVEARTQRIQVDDSDWGFNAGFLWRINNQLNLGGSYRQSPSFDGTEEILHIEESGTSQGAIRFPDSFGLGLAFQNQKRCSRHQHRMGSHPIFGRRRRSFQRRHPRQQQRVSCRNRVRLHRDYAGLGSTWRCVARSGTNDTICGRRKGFDQTRSVARGLWIRSFLLAPAIRSRFGDLRLRSDRFALGDHQFLDVS